MFIAGLLAAALSVTALAPAPPAAEGLPPAIQRSLPPRWSTAFDNPSCAAVKKVSLTAQQATVAAQCVAVPGCVAHAVEGGGATVVATIKIGFENGTYRLTSQLVEVPSGKVLEQFAPPNVATANALDVAFGAAARKLCSTLSKTTPGADLELAEVGFDDLPPMPATTGKPDAKRPKPAANPAMDLDLDIETPVPAAKPGKPAVAALPDLDLELEPAKPATKPAKPAETKVAAVTPKPAETKPAATVEPAPTKPQVETILATAPTATPKDPLVAPPTEPAVQETPTDGRRLGAWIAGGVAVLAGGGGAVFGNGALSAAHTRDAALDYPGFAAAQADAERSGRLANVSFGLAATAAVTSAVLFALSADAP